MRQNPGTDHLPYIFRGTLGAAIVLLLAACTSATSRAVSGAQAYSLAKEFLVFGPRVSGTEGNRKAGDWIKDQLEAVGWDGSSDLGMYFGTPVRNIFGIRGQGPVMILGAHYDSRRCADQPGGGCAQPVLGANDGASGVAVLLELARTLECDWTKRQVWLVFFDAEDNGGLDGWDWIAGSRQFAGRIPRYAPGAEVQGMVLLDMVGDADQQFYFEGHSDQALREAIWAAARSLGYEDYFIPARKFSMLDDHIPFRDAGIPAVDIIDFDYPYWHTGEDTLDKISAASLERIGRTVEVWLERGGQPASPVPSDSAAPAGR